MSYVITADSAIVNLFPARGSLWAGARWSLWETSPQASPAVQLSLDRLLARADGAIRRDLAAVSSRVLHELVGDEFPVEDVRVTGLAVVAQYPEVGLDLVRPLPPIDKAEALRVSAIRHFGMVLEPWLDGVGAYPDWKHLHEQIMSQVPSDVGPRSLTLFMLADRLDALFGIYGRLGRKK